MGTDDRQEDDPLRKAICTNADGFDFFRLLSLLEAREGVPLGTQSSAKRERFRLQQEVSLSFPTSQVASASYDSDADRLAVVVRCLGLFGPSGALPTVLSEHIARRVRSQRDKTLYSFINLFQHRLLTLFYRAWALNRRCVDFAWGEESRQQRYQGALVALHSGSGDRCGRLEPEARLYHAGTFGGYTANRSSLCAMLEDYFEVPVTIEEFVGNWLEIPAEERACLGRRPATTTIGRNCVLGERIWNAHLKFRLHLGPIGHADFLRFLPNHESFYKLQDAIRKYVGNHFACDLRMTLRAEEVPEVQLGKVSYLGWNTWLGKRPSSNDAKDYSVSLHHYSCEHYGIN
jgi:type VI secretion system protein ImpH